MMINIPWYVYPSAKPVDVMVITGTSNAIKFGAKIAEHGLNSDQIERRILQRRTLSIEGQILMTLRFIDFKTSEPQSATSRIEF